jgi:hypothetical protein
MTVSPFWRAVAQLFSDLLHIQAEVEAFTQLTRPSQTHSIDLKSVEGEQILQSIQDEPPVEGPDLGSHLCTQNPDGR